ncbi:uncharacterized protein LOC131956750 isoform X2 [Physella acuta]|uniref:uncharacterized protein LOC131956750 isoform X2 n=1 Tax=Physella acuta TaxID=109671 RepID=UPI0027DB799C|nr:uncharacterized protein LOC131956750 isoform X2 [Physella acuta]
MANMNLTFGKMVMVVMVLVLAGMSVVVYKTRVEVQNMTGSVRIKNSHELAIEEQWKTDRFRRQRNLLSSTLNHMMMLYGQQSCEMLKLKKVNDMVSENGGWCAVASSPTSSQHVWDEGFSKALSTFFKGKSVGSFGDGPGAYKRHLDTLKEVKSYTAYDGAPYCELVTNGTVLFLDLTVPQYNLPIFDWVISVEVGEHIPAKFEDIYLDNLARHAREGIVLSWAVPGQGGLSHVNNKPLEAVVQQLKVRGFEINLDAGAPLRDSAGSSWLKKNVHVYYRPSHSLVAEDDA